MNIKTHTLDRKMKITCIVALIFLSRFAYAQGDAGAVDQLHKRKFVWLIQKQYDSLEIFLDNNLHYLHSNGWIQTKRDVIDDLKKGKPVYDNIQVEESAVALYPGCAIVTGKGTFRGRQADQTEFNIRLLYTEVYIKSKKKWLLAHRQATKL